MDLWSPQVRTVRLAGWRQEEQLLVGIIPITVDNSNPSAPRAENVLLSIHDVDLRKSLAAVERNIVVQGEGHVVVVAITDDPSNESNYWPRGSRSTSCDTSDSRICAKRLQNRIHVGYTVGKCPAGQGAIAAR